MLIFSFAIINVTLTSENLTKSDFQKYIMEWNNFHSFSNQFFFVRYCSYITLTLYSMCHDKILGKMVLTIFFNVLSVWLSFILLNLNKTLMVEQSNETSSKILAEKGSSSITPYHSSFPPALELYNRFLSVLFDVLFFLNIPGKWDYFTCIQRPISMVKWNQRDMECISLSTICSDVQWCSSIVKKIPQLYQPEGAFRWFFWCG